MLKRILVYLLVAAAFVIAVERISSAYADVDMDFQIREQLERNVPTPPRIPLKPPPCTTFDQSFGRCEPVIQI